MACSSYSKTLLTWRIKIVPSLNGAKTSQKSQIVVLFGTAFSHLDGMLFRSKSDRRARQIVRFPAIIELLPESLKLIDRGNLVGHVVMSAIKPKYYVVCIV